MQKKTWALLLAIIILASLFTAQVSAESKNTANSDLKGLAEQYLKNCTYNMYMYSENDLKSSTLLALADEANAKIADDMASASIIFSDEALVPNISFIIEKCNYFKAIRSDQGITRKDFNVEYYFDDVILKNKFACVPAREYISFYYEGIDELTEIITSYNVLLYSNDNQWYIIGVTSDDWFDGANKYSRFDSKKAIDDYFSAKSSSANDTATAEVEVPEVFAQSNVSKIRGYSSANAWKYAYTYTTGASTGQTNYYNSNFVSLSADCQNFASQCVWAGFGGDNTAASVNGCAVPMDNVGSGVNYRWYANPSSVHWAWTACSYFRNYLINSANDTGMRLTANIYDVDKAVSSIPSNTGELVGSVMHVYGSAGAYEHAIVVTTANSRSRSDIYYCAHTGHAKNVRLSDSWPAQNSDRGAIKVIRPVAFYDVVDCPGRTSHVYSSVSSGNGSDSVCNNCGHNRMELRTQWIEPKPLNSTLSLTSQSSLSAYRYAMKITRPDGGIEWLNQQTGGASITNQYTFTQRGLYTVTVQCRDKNPDIYSDSTVVENSVQIRIY